MVFLETHRVLDLANLDSQMVLGILCLLPLDHQLILDGLNLGSHRALSVVVLELLGCHPILKCLDLVLEGLLLVSLSLKLFLNGFDFRHELVLISFTLLFGSELLVLNAFQLGT